MMKKTQKQKNPKLSFDKNFLSYSVIKKVNLLVLIIMLWLISANWCLKKYGFKLTFMWSDTPWSKGWRHDHGSTNFEGYDKKDILTKLPWKISDKGFIVNQLPKMFTKPKLQLKPHMPLQQDIFAE